MNTINELAHSMRIRSAATTAVAQLLIRLADDECDMHDLRDGLVPVGDALNVDTALLLMACSPFDFEAGKHGLALLEAMRQDQPRDEQLRLYIELGKTLGFDGQGDCASCSRS